MLELLHPYDFMLVIIAMSMVVGIIAYGLR